MTSVPLPNSTQPAEVVKARQFLTKRCTEEYLQVQYELSTSYSCTRVSECKWLVTYNVSNVECTAQHPVFERTREVTMKDGCLYCSCKYMEDYLSPCRHIISVKNGMLCEQDFHIRHFATWQSGHIPYEICPRTFEDLQCAPTCLGVDLEAAIQGMN